MAERVVLVTGASSGIGLACARQLSERGIRVVGASRREVTGAGWSTVRMDVDNDESVAGTIEQVVDEYGGIDAVVTCAGWGLAGSVEKTPISAARAQFETNFFGTVRTVTAALPSLRARKGNVVLMSSLGGLIGIPFQAYYSASKFALEGWGEALAWELRPHGVHVTLIEPGNFHTGFTGSRRVEQPAPGDPYAHAQQKAVSVMERDEIAGADPHAVAEAVERILSSPRPPRRVTVGPMSERIGPMAKRLLPFKLFEAAAKNSLGV